MKNLFVGQRVRVVGIWMGDPKMNPVGKTGFIAAQGEFKGEMTGAIFPWAVKMDGELTPYRVFAHSHELEPIVDPGHKVISWDRCLWQPEHERHHE